MQPFKISEPGNKLIGHYPNADLVSSAAQEMNKLEREYFLRLWLSEGIPLAFSKKPFLYELIRSWLAKNIGVNSKEITLVGSARIGYSLSPYPKFGKLFDSNSDLDFAVISEKLFSDLSETFYKWKREFEEGLVYPRGSKESSYWQENITRLPKNIGRGFIDLNKIPSWDRYPLAKNILNFMAVLQKKLSITPDAPKIKKASLRVYRDWDDFIRQVSLNFDSTLKTLQLVRLGE